ncbi:MAG: NADH:flavin oxidoreductase [Planctomycetes bacterium]|nr:NADH:flavin oxidoreductase [Planctomycetota bacterium]
MADARRERFTPPGHHRELGAFRDHWRAVAPDLGVDDAVRADGPLSRPLEVFGRRLSNRFATHPMEGWDGTADGQPTDLTLRRWRRFGRSGAALVWGGEAFAVCPDGRANPRQLALIDPARARDGLRRLLAELRAGQRELGADPAGIAVGLQLTHSGRWSRPLGAPAPRTAARDAVLDARVGITDDRALLSDAELIDLRARYVAAARIAHDAGFDFVDVKVCHGYLLHELLGARGRPGPYGGELRGRTRLFREIVESIRAACPGLGIGARVSIVDPGPFAAGPGDGVGVPVAGAAGIGFGRPGADGAFELGEPLEFLRLCSALDVRVVNLTIGSPYYCPHVQRPAAYPPSDGYLPPADPLAAVATHLRVARACKAAVPELTTVGTGYTYLQEWLGHVAQHEVGGGHVDLVGLGRMLLSYPELPRDLLAGRPLQRKLLCRTFSDCTTAPRNGIVSGCYPLDPHYRALPEAADLKAIKQRLADA